MKKSMKMKMWTPLQPQHDFLQQQRAGIAGTAGAAARTRILKKSSDVCSENAGDREAGSTTIYIRYNIFNNHSTTTRVYAGH